MNKPIVFESTLEIKITKSIRSKIIVVPSNIKELLHVLDERLKSVEFIVLLHASFIKKKQKFVILLGEDYYIPQQEVSIASATITEAIDTTLWNCVVHKHPCGLREFSATDLESICANFPVSLLLADGKIVKASISKFLTVPHPRKIIRVGNVITRCKKSSQSPLKLEGIERIKEKSIHNWYYFSFWKKMGNNLN